MESKEKLHSDNVDMKFDGYGILTITIDTRKRLGLSGSRKSFLVASTRGNVSVPGAEYIKIGLNAYTYERAAGAPKLKKCDKYWQKEAERKRVADALGLLEAKERGAETAWQAAAEECPF